MANGGEADDDGGVDRPRHGHRAVQEEGEEAYMGTGIFDGVLGAATARRVSVEATAAAYHNFFAQAQQTLPGIRRTRTQGIAAGALRGRNLGALVVVDDLGAAYDNPGMDMVAQHLRVRRLLPFAGIGACSVAVNGLATGPASPAVAFHLFVLLLAGLFLVILHVLRMYPMQPKIDDVV